MARIPHGGKITIEQISEASEDPVLGALAFGVPVSPGGTDFFKFGYMFGDLQGDADLLPVGPGTVAHLKALGAAMHDLAPNDSGGDAEIPAAYTYLGQFIDHDITFELQSGKLASIHDPNLVPLSLLDVQTKIMNTRSANFDLDSVYGGQAQRVEGDAEMAVGVVASMPDPSAPFSKRPTGKDDFNDVPRKNRINKIDLDREALIGDPRNDENTIVSQLHLAFLRAHNAIASIENDFEKARRSLRQHYQWMVVHDFLKRIADPDIVDATLQANQHYALDGDEFFMPLEFSVAAYRFGHSMIRTAYDFNLNFNTSGQPATTPATLRLLFTFSALSGDLGDFATLPENWIIEWERLLDLGGNAFDKARRFDTKLVEPLAHLRTFDGQELPNEARLAVRNLLRGYLLRMPTGQSVAGKLGLPVLSTAELAAASTPEQAQILAASGFDERTPLWFYILAEASHFGGQRLGPVGSTIVAEVIIGLVRRSDDSILDPAGFAPTLGTTPGEFDLSDLLRLAGVLA